MASPSRSEGPVASWPDPSVVEAWRPARLTIDPWLVLRLTGYRRRDAVTPPIWEAAVQMAGRAEALIEPRALVVAAPVARVGPDGIELRDGTAFSGQAVRRLLTGCSHAVAFVLTLGPRLEAEAALLASRRELLEAFLLETAGWAAIEGAVRGLRLDLAARARARDAKLSHRLAPGYVDWPLEEQRALLPLIPFADQLVRLTEHGLLVPLKSITGVFGLGGLGPAAGRHA